MHVYTCMHVHKYMHMHACTACVEQLRSVPYPPNWFTHSATYVYCKMHIYMRTCTYAHVHIRMAPAQLPTVIWRACVPPPPPPTWGEAISVCYLTLAIVATSLGCATPALCPQLLTVVWGRQGPLGPTRLQSSWLQPEPPTHPPTHPHTHITGLKHFGRKQEGQHCPFCGACERD